MLELRNIVVDYPARGQRAFGAVRTMRAVDHVDLLVGEGETVGLVGESGSGKSTLGRIAIRLLRPTEGTVSFLGQPIHDVAETRLRPMRAQMGIVFQDPYASLNPRQRLETILSLPFRVHTAIRGSTLRRHVLNLLDRVGLRPADQFTTKFPHQLSGGQRQRVAIARAIALRPRLIVADEPVSSLDVSVGAQILDLLRDLQRELGMSYLFISHDLAVVHSMARRVAVMYRGQIVEEGPSSDVLLRAAHPYTQLLVASIPQLLSDGESVAAARTPREDSTTRCHFETRCPHAFDRCYSETPELKPVDRRSEHRVRCFAATIPSPPDSWLRVRQALTRRLNSGAESTP
jgi:peptide/nickel transport system ATP-binding protein